MHQTAVGDDGEEEYQDSGWPTATFDAQAFLDRKSLLTIELIKDVIGEVMSACKKRKYPILEYIMKMVLYEKNALRDSFMQEVLYAAENAAFRNSLQSYLNENGMKTASAVLRFDPETQQVLPFDEHELAKETTERVIEVADVDMNVLSVRDLKT